MTNPSSPEYRHELDGVRAIAVLAVLGYHAGYNDFAGGFMGVDVFLVLSGFLIVQQITRALDAGRFHAGRFWLRRIRRLLPAMIPVLGFALLSALLLKGQGAFEAFASHFLSAGLFFSNYQFLSEADYFARASTSNLLLHTWSLSLEWQFYLVTPIILMVVHRFGRRAIFAALSVLAIASLLFAEVLLATARDSWAFFGVMPRYWEFAAGGLVALIPPVLARLPQAGVALRLIGLGLVLWAIFGPVPDSFPGLGAGWAVAGTAVLLLAPSQSRDPVRWLLERRWMLWVGQRSYAIYLIHWPLFVTVTPASMNKSEGILSVALLASLFLGHLIYRHVETPVRTGAKFKSSHAILQYGGVALAAVVGIGLALPTSLVSTLRASLPLYGIRATATEIDVVREEYFTLLEQIHANALPEIRFCSYDTLATSADVLACVAAADIPDDAVLLIGDSHGRDAVAALSRAYPDQVFVMMHQSACVPAAYTRGRSDCFPNLSETLTALAEAGRLSRVILASRWWQGEHQAVAATLAALTEAEADTLIIGPGPTFDAPMDGIATEAAFTGVTLRDLNALGPSRFAFDVRSVNRDLHQMADAAGAVMFDRFELFCPDDLCPLFDGPEGGILFMDDQHLSRTGIDVLANALAQDPGVQSLMTGR